MVSTCSGINFITQVDLDSPAGLSGKIDVGDEILEVFIVSLIF